MWHPGEQLQLEFQYEMVHVLATIPQLSFPAPKGRDWIMSLKMICRRMQ
ncbi:hypothetical protein Gorai_012520 [Gossypium raimondii]|uniref:Uncharacterized protein n=1 Tax=Gossypium raimondii TaxID=29730 RepID=A0A7J8Q341_GOSRA|nr:hypothetical protein [Gossypium raimondii]